MPHYHLTSSYASGLENPEMLLEDTAKLNSEATGVSEDSVYVLRGKSRSPVKQLTEDNAQSKSVT